MFAVIFLLCLVS